MTFHSVILEVGHFTINAGYRFKPDIFLGVFKAAIEFAMEHDVSFLANCSYVHSAPMYEKIGFVQITDKPIPDTVLGVDTCSSILNLSALVIYNKDTLNKTKTIDQLKPLLNQYIMERYYKRQLILNTFKKMKTCDLKVENLFGSMKIVSGVC